MENQKEIWKDVLGYEEIYQVSNLGNVKSLQRLIRLGYRPRIKKETILKNSIEFYGYYVVNLCKNLKHKKTKVHRIVAEAFIPNPENKPQINHKNGIKTDNCVENLEWCTNQENAIHANKNNLISRQKGSSSHKSKLTEKQVLEIRNLSVSLSYRKLASLYNVTHQNIRSIVLKETWTHI
jgi:hypothetical protein